MNDSELEQIKAALIPKIEEAIVKRLEEKYFMIPKNAWLSFLGGILAFGIAVGVVSYKSALVALTEPAVQSAKEAVFRARDESSNALKEIRNNLEKSGVTETRLGRFETDLKNKVAIGELYRIRSDLPVDLDAATNATLQNMNAPQGMVVGKGDNLRPGTNWHFVDTGKPAANH